MQKISYRRHRFPPHIIQNAVWLYARFTLSYRDVEDLLAERGLDISYESVRRRERKMQRFKSPGSAQRFLNIQTATYNSFYFQRHLLNRMTFKQYRVDAFVVWKCASAAA